MTKVLCEIVAVGDRVHVEGLDHEPMLVTRTEIRGGQVFLYGGTGNVISMFKGSVVERDD